jgi:hypothetical protein
MTLAESNLPTEKLPAILDKFTVWLEKHGETSWDHQSFYAGPVGRRAKGLYYKNKLLGTAAVAPMVFGEAFFPPVRRLFHQRIRLPIADAHYAMGFAFLNEASGKSQHHERAVHFLHVLRDTCCPGFQDAGWGYPFDWVWMGGTIKAQTPLITTTPYAFEALLQVQQLQPRDEWRNLIASTVRHVTTDIKDFKYSATATTCSYTPTSEGGVVNASSYRAAMLVMAGKFLGEERLLNIAAGNVNFVLESQSPDGSWPYAKDGRRDFVDHFHTCFVMKGLAKVLAVTGDLRIHSALERGLEYYLKNLFGEDGMPRPFSRAPRLTVYKCELYDCAECINLCLLLRPLFPQLNQTLATVVNGILKDWIKPDGSFRSRKLILGWDNVPMHRWAQSQMFRSLAYYLRESKIGGLKP